MAFSSSPGRVFHATNLKMRSPNTASAAEARGKQTPSQLDFGSPDQAKSRGLNAGSANNMASHFSPADLSTAAPQISDKQALSAPDNAGDFQSQQAPIKLSPGKSKRTNARKSNKGNRQEGQHPNNKSRAPRDDAFSKQVPDSQDTTPQVAPIPAERPLLKYSNSRLDNIFASTNSLTRSPAEFAMTLEEEHHPENWSEAQFAGWISSKNSSITLGGLFDAVRSHGNQYGRWYMSQQMLSNFVDAAKSGDRLNQVIDRETAISLFDANATLPSSPVHRVLSPTLPSPQLDQASTPVPPLNLEKPASRHLQTPRATLLNGKNPLLSKSDPLLPRAFEEHVGFDEMQAVGLGLNASLNTLSARDGLSAPRQFRSIQGKDAMNEGQARAVDFQAIKMLSSGLEEQFKIKIAERDAEIDVLKERARTLIESNSLYAQQLSNSQVQVHELTESRDTLLMELSRARKDLSEKTAAMSALQADQAGEDLETRRLYEALTQEKASNAKLRACLADMANTQQARSHIELQSVQVQTESISSDALSAEMLSEQLATQKASSSKSAQCSSDFINRNELHFKSLNQISSATQMMANELLPTTDAQTDTDFDGSFTEAIDSCIEARSNVEDMVGVQTSMTGEDIDSYTDTMAVYRSAVAQVNRENAFLREQILAVRLERSATPQDDAITLEDQEERDLELPATFPSQSSVWPMAVLDMMDRIKKTCKSTEYRQLVTSTIVLLLATAVLAVSRKSYNQDGYRPDLRPSYVFAFEGPLSFLNSFVNRYEPALTFIG